MPAMPPYQPCIPAAGKAVPARPEWVHEVKYDGYRLIVVREDKRVRLITRNGHGPAAFLVRTQRRGRARRVDIAY
jgi:ATP-dependent DNA ligase